MKLTVSRVPETEHRPEHMCSVCNRNTAGCERVRLRVDGIFVASIHANCAFGEHWTADVIAETQGATLDRWLKAHPKAHAEDWLGSMENPTPTHVKVYPNGEDTRGLFQLSSHVVSSANGPWLCLIEK